jgi:DNA-binding Xre family transcriptional regulator
MAGAKVIKQLMIERNIPVNELATKLGIKPQSMSNKLHRDNFSFEELLQISDILNCDIRIITRDTNKTFEP